jgi:phosphoribosylamine--glycine ligase
MNILVIGSGGREHALAWKIKQSPLVEKLYCLPGNGGMAEIAECIDISVTDINSILNFAKEKQIDLTVVGPELPLVLGIVDIFEAAGLPIFGPSKSAAQLEGSKLFSKTMMEKYGVPTAKFKVFNCSQEANKYIMELEPPYIIKADGLASGKGVFIAQSTSQAVAAISDILDKKIFGDAGQSLIIEEFIDGQELSVLAFTDGNVIIPLASAQDHKRAYDNDEGPNTGGMGAYSPCPLIEHDDLTALIEQTIKPIIQGLKSEGIVYRGLIYAGLMISKKGPMVLEYNVRFGDPETQAIIPRLKDDIVPVFLQVANGALTQQSLSWDHKACISVVIAASGYPNSKYEKGHVINGLELIDTSKAVAVFHSGTIRKDHSIIANGGRLFSVSALGDTLKDAQVLVYKEINKIKMDKMFYRKDIGSKAFQELNK